MLETSSVLVLILIKKNTKLQEKILFIWGEIWFL